MWKVLPVRKLTTKQRGWGRTTERTASWWLVHRCCPSPAARDKTGHHSRLFGSSLERYKIPRAEIEIFSEKNVPANPSDESNRMPDAAMTGTSGSILLCIALRSWEPNGDTSALHRAPLTGTNLQVTCSLSRKDNELSVH